MRALKLLTLAAAIAAAPALAQDKPVVASPVVNREVDAADVAKTPVTDLNLTRDKIPQLLIDAQASPYDLAGLDRCPALIKVVDQFNVMLGADIDLPQAERERVSAGRVAKSVVGSFIPFRGIVREISGANDHDRRLQAAIEAGIARRSFLKGVGQTKGCRYPARMAGPRTVAAFRNEQAAARSDDKQDAKATGK